MLNKVVISSTNVTLLWFNISSRIVSTSTDSMNGNEFCSIVEFFLWHLRDVAVRTFGDQIKELSIRTLAIDDESEVEIFNKYILPDVQLNAQQQMIVKAKHLFKAILNAIEETNSYSLDEWQEKISISFQEKNLMQIIIKRGYSSNIDCFSKIRQLLKQIESKLKFTTCINVKEIAQSMQTHMLMFKAQTDNAHNNIVSSVEENVLNEVNQELESILTKYAKKEIAKLEQHTFQPPKTLTLDQSSGTFELPVLNSLENDDFLPVEEPSQFVALMQNDHFLNENLPKNPSQKVDTFHNEPIHQQPTPERSVSTDNLQNYELLNEPIHHAPEHISNLKNSQNALFYEGPIEFEPKQVTVLSDESDGPVQEISTQQDTNICTNETTNDCKPIVFEQSLAYECSLLRPPSPKRLPMSDLHKSWVASSFATVAQKVLGCKERDMIKVKKLTCNEENCTDLPFKKRDFYRHLQSVHKIKRHRCHHHKECKMNFSKK